MVTSKIRLENARIAFKNFSGKPGQYNSEGKRNFCVMLDSELADQLSDEGWNIKHLKPREEGEDPQAYMSVEVNFRNIPPKVVLITSKGKTILDEGDINCLDWAEIENVDLVIRPYNWEVNGKVGVKAYIQSMWVTLAEDEFEAKYYDVPDSAMSALIQDRAEFD